jgi:hypothetical protein
MFPDRHLGILQNAVHDLGFEVLLAPDRPPETELIKAITQSDDLTALNRSAGAGFLDLTVSDDNRPFFFNQLRFSYILQAMQRLINGTLGTGVMKGNLLASAVLVIILFMSIVAVISTILVPLSGAAQECSTALTVTGSLYFSLIGMGFMLAEIAILQRFSVYLGHPIYSLGVCLFSLIIASGSGSLTSERLKLDAPGKLVGWGGVVVVYLIALAQFLPALLESTTDRDRMFRIGISLLAIMPLGFLLGFAFPTGMRLVENIDRRPTPWFWGINGAAGVLASVLGLMLNMSLGIHFTLLVSAGCYLFLILASIALLRFGQMQYLGDGFASDLPC